MKLGTEVAVCHDGKWGRRVKGVVVATRRGHHIKVQFPHPETGEPVEFWARKIPAIRYQKRRGSDEYGYITTLDRPAYFGGWADINWWCPWYAVHRWVGYEEEELG